MMVRIVVWALLMEVATSHLLYVMVCPRTVRPGMDFVCHFTRESKFPRLNMTAIVTQDGQPIVSQTFDIEGVDHSFSLQIPNNLTSSRSYRLEVNGTDNHGATVIDRTYYLTSNSKNNSIFILTDKTIYQSGQTVQFRVFVVNSDLEILRRNMDIDIFDPAKNRIAIWRNVRTDSGVLQGEMVTSTQPLLGEWSIEVVFDDADKKTKWFTVTETVEPKFIVNLSTQEYGIMTDKYLTGTIDARNTFGKAVKGNGTLFVYRKQSYSERFTLTFKINGSYRFQLNREELFNFLNINHTRSLQLRASVTDEQNDITEYEYNEIHYYTRKEKLLIDGAEFFKPGLSYTIYLFLTDQRHRPLATDKPEVSTNIEYIAASDQSLVGTQINKTVQIHKNGIGVFSLKVPNGVKQLMIKATYRDLTVSKGRDQFYSPTESYIQVKSLAKDIKTGNNASFLITSTRPKTWVYYMIKAKSGVSKTGKVFMTSRKVVVTILITRDLLTTARMVVYYIKKNDEVVADSIHFDIERIFDNKVNLRFKKTKMKPGQKVSLIVKASPGSQCNVLAVDKTMLLLRKGNDITVDDIEDNIRAYEDIRTSRCTGPCARELFPMTVPARDVSTIFRESQLAIFTSAELPRYSGPRSTWPTIASESSKSSSSSTWSSTWSSSSSTATSAAIFAEDPELESELKAPLPKLRGIFPDTWIYSNSEVANSRGNCIIKTTIPDRITSWVATAFAVHNSSGLGVAPESARLDAFLKFFVRLELPYSVTRGEQFLLTASVFNFFKTDLEVGVTLRNTGCFDSFHMSQSQNGSSVWMYSKEGVYREIMVKAGDAATVKFAIRPAELGNCKINVQGISARASDSAQTDLLVKAEGIEENYNIQILIETVNGENDFAWEQAVTLPEKIVPGSVKIRMAAFGDPMVPTLRNMNYFIRKSYYGGGERNMVYFVPTIFAIRYLETVKKLEPRDMEKGKLSMISGFQRELRYQRTDGSFSNYASDSSGSTWLTAFVVKAFAEASKYIYIDPAVLDTPIKWVLGQYNNTTGLFNEVGYIPSSNVKGQLHTGPFTTTSTTLIALLEAKKSGFTGDEQLFNSVTGDVIETLESKVETMDNIYDLATTAYALALGRSPKVDGILQKLDNMSTIEGDMKYWGSPSLSYHDSAKIVETNAYIVLTYLAMGDLGNAFSVTKWLIKQINGYGRFSTTQDTVMGLQAISDVAAMLSGEDVDLNIDIYAKPSQTKHEFHVDKENSQLFQTLYLPDTTSLVQIKARGNGFALVQMFVTYNVMEDPVEPMFSLILSTTDERKNRFKFKACFNWLGDGVSDMAVMEIGLLSGFSADRFTVTSLGILKMTEDGDNMAILYFDEIPSEMECIELVMTRTDPVANTQPAVVKLYDYHEPDNHVFGLYQPELLRKTSICDVGGDDDVGCAWLLPPSDDSRR